MSGLVRVPLAHQVYRELRARIVSGQLRAGSRLLPEGLAESMSISQTPIKEALVRLEADGLVEAPSRRGAMVRRFTPADIGELYEARLLIEQHALRVAMREGRVTPAVVAEMRRTLSDHAREIGRRTLEGLGNALALDREFHAKIVALGGNGLIAEWHAKIMLQTHSVAVYTAEGYPIQPTVREHEAVFAALAQGDRAGALAALERHLSRSRDELMAQTERDGRELAEV